MHPSSLLTLLCILTAGSLLAGDITPEDAGKRVGEKVTIRGTVVQAIYSKSKNGYLNFGDKYPNQIFAVAVLNAKTPALLANGPGRLTELQGKEIAVTGTIELYEGNRQGLKIACIEEIASLKGWIIPRAITRAD